jgi:hypothetical protein
VPIPIVRFAYTFGVPIFVPKRVIRADQTSPKFQRHVLIHRAGMRLLLLHTQFRQQVDDNAGLDFQFPCQLVDSDFLHRWNC